MGSLAYQALGHARVATRSTLWLDVDPEQRCGRSTTRRATAYVPSKLGREGEETQSSRPVQPDLEIKFRGHY